MNETTTQETTTWQDVAAASEEASAGPAEVDIAFVRRETRLVRVKLAETAVADLGRELAQEEADYEAILAERKAANADFRERLEEARTKIKALGEAIKTGARQEEREVIVRRVNASTVQLVDPETGAILDEIADVEDDRQLTLADAAKGNGHAEEDEDDGLGEDPSGDEFVPDLTRDPDDEADACLDGDEPSAGDIVDPAGVIEGAAPDEEQPKKRGRGKRS